ncbi:MAG: Zn-ribbon domain-containing OB-fold protein [Desulfitobacteriaceae bacterium]
MSDYIFTIDPFPLQTKEHNKLYPFFDALKEGRLVNSECPKCNEMFWPPRSVCPNCMEDNLEWKELSHEGTIVAFSVQESGVPLGFKAPLIFAVVEIENRVRLFTHLLDSNLQDVKLGTKVKLVVENVANDRVLPAFTVII